MKKGRIGLIGAAVAAAATIGATANAAGPPPPKATGGGTITQFAAGLHTPTSFAFGPGGAVFEGDGGSTKSKVPNGGVFLLKGGTATKLAGSPLFVSGVLWHAGTLYVAGGTPSPKGATFTLQAWSGWNGAKFASQKVIYTAPKGFQGFNGLGYAGGRLYVGVDLGLLDNNDHGPATTSPYVYDILTIKPNGTGLKVFATGIRQPWQMVFPAGSTSPLVSDLGQDKAAKTPLDAILRVKQGDNFGFPKCAPGVGSCTGFAKPFATFSPHTDIMGLAIAGKTLYMTSFLSTTGKGPGGEVLSMPLKGGKAKPVVTGFVAPVVGLGLSGGYLYIGELTGQVFRLKVG